ncbi:RDI1 [Malassezia furfur]|nr:RDI1 [Malassezia furfur]
MASASPAVQDDLNPTPTAGYNPGQKKSLQEYAALDAEDESLRRWKESLGISTGAGALDPNAPKLTIHSLSLVSDAIASGSITLQLDQPGDLERASKTPLQIPEGIEYAVAIRFTIIDDDGVVYADFTWSFKLVKA